MSSTNIPGIRFPNAMDDYSSLLRVHNRSESKLAKDFFIDSDSIEIVPDFSRPEMWSGNGGYIHIDGEDIFYSRGDFVYSVPLERRSIEGVVGSSYSPIHMESPIAINEFDPQLEEKNSVTLRGPRYTVIGTLLIGGRAVDFTVQGNGRHGHGAIFNFSKNDVVQRQLCYVNADTGELFIASVPYSYNVVRLFFMKTQLDTDGSIKRRLYRMHGLLRGLNQSAVKQHDKGDYVRGYIVAQHHRLLVDAILAMQNHVGVDYSEVRPSIDFRLRDLTDICIETDDYDCPELQLSYRRLEEDCDNRNTYVFDIDIGGRFDDFSLFFGDGTQTSEFIGIEKTYGPDNRVEPRAIASNDKCATSNAYFEQSAQVADTIPELPAIICPEIIIPEIPIQEDFIIPTIDMPDTFITIDFPSMSWPDFTFEFPEITFPDISISIDINTSITIPPLTIHYSVVVEGPEGEGPCFQLVPCGTGHCHGF